MCLVPCMGRALGIFILTKITASTFFQAFDLVYRGPGSLYHTRYQAGTILIKCTIFFLKKVMKDQVIPCPPHTLKAKDGCPFLCHHRC